MATRVKFVHIESAEAIVEFREMTTRAVRIMYPIETMKFGVREFGLLDDNGYQLSFAQHVAVG
ncbi:hypothetical protein U1R88_24840 [Labrys sp. ZIDIC5]|nr:hypothetical protein [Labrys sp. ZIDIC5]